MIDIKSILAGGRDRLKQSWQSGGAKRYLIIGAIALACCLGSYSCGRYAQPPQVVEKEHVVTKVETKVETQVQYKDRVVEKVVERKVYVRVAQKNVHQVVTDTVKPDGTKEHRVETTDLSQTKTSNEDDKNKTRQDDQQVQAQQTATQKEDQTIDHTKTVTLNLPQWRIGAQVGYDLLAPFQGTRGVPGMAGLVIGVEGDRRIWKGLWLGLWGNTQAAVGLKLDLEL